MSSIADQDLADTRAATLANAGEVAPPFSFTRDGVEPCAGAPCGAVGEVNFSRQPKPTQPYLDDLAVIERCENAIVEQGGCPDFFACMGTLARGRCA